MAVTFKCKGCGLEIGHVKGAAHTVCFMCGTPRQFISCRKCGEVKPLYVKYNTVCKECFKINRPPYKFIYGHRRWNKLKEMSTELFGEWIDLIKELPEPYEMLTQKQWLDACRHFNKCALCHEAEIDTRGFFIQFKSGGRYCDWNVIPICEECAKTWKMHWNPWYRIKYGNRKQYRKYNKERLGLIEVYLKGKMEAWKIRWHAQNTSSDLETSTLNHSTYQTELSSESAQSSSEDSSQT